MPKTAGNKVSQAGNPVSASRTEMTEVVLPQDANVFGNILGGRVMHLVDIAAAVKQRIGTAAPWPSLPRSITLIFAIRFASAKIILLKASLNRLSYLDGGRRKGIFEDILTGESEAHHERLRDLRGPRREPPAKAGASGDLRDLGRPPPLSRGTGAPEVSAGPPRGLSLSA